MQDWRLYRDRNFAIAWREDCYDNKHSIICNINNAFYYFNEGIYYLIF